MFVPRGISGPRHLIYGMIYAASAQGPLLQLLMTEVSHIVVCIGMGAFF